VGSAGFLCESFDFMKAKPGLTTREFSTLQTRTFYGKEKKSLAYVIAIMNMILHGIEAPNIIRMRQRNYRVDKGGGVDYRRAAQAVGVSSASR
jgi:type I restriction-modification system DNA methylase subunit